MKKVINLGFLVGLATSGILLVSVPTFAESEITLESKEETVIESSTNHLESTTENTETGESTESTTNSIDTINDGTTSSTTRESSKDSVEIKEDEQEIELDQGPYQEYGEYVTISNGNETTYRNFSWDKLYETKTLIGKTFFAKGKYEHKNGNVYLSLFDSEGKWYGYLDSKAVEVGPGRQGIYQNHGEYVTISSKNYETYTDFTWTKRDETKNIYGKTYHAKGKYNHFNGSTYLSLYDNAGKWQGYVNEKATKNNGRQGAYQDYGKFVTISSKNYEIFRNFSWDKLNDTKNVYGKTYQARGKYNHFNGSTYLSLYDNTGKWQGYVNEKASKVGGGRQGAYQDYGKFVTITSRNYETYQNFSWTKLNETKNIYGKTYHAKGKYNHFNGSTYLSLYDNTGKWFGYVNEKATQTGNGRQGVYQDLNRHVIVSSKNYDMWRNFDWEVKQSSSKKYNQGLIAKGQYNHFNGSTYYSVYDGLGNWQGYINAKGTQLVTNKQNPTTYYSQMSVRAWYGCAATSLYTTLKAKNYAGNVTLVEFINGLPLSNNNPDEGQIGSPWSEPFTRVISPIGLNKYARSYTPNSEVISGSSTDRVITEINSGNYVLFWGEYAMRYPDTWKDPQHVMIAKGYKVVGNKEYILIQDPGMYSPTDYRALHWYEKGDFDRYITKKYRKMMVVR